MMHESQELEWFPTKMGFPFKLRNSILSLSCQETRHLFAEQQTSKPSSWLPQGHAFRPDSTEPSSRKRRIQKGHTVSVLLVHMFKGGAKCSCEGEREVASSGELFLQTAGGLRNEDLAVMPQSQKLVTLTVFDVDLAAI